MQLGWIDFSKDERNKVFSVINLLDEPGAVDELGLGVIRDAFANYFFPGTSTVQTRAKYFFIVPYILKEAGTGEYGSDPHKIIKRINDEERRCRDILIKKSSDGVIGSRNPYSWVQRTPLSIYWNGMKELGILTENISLREYVLLTINQRSAKKAREYGNREKDAEENEKDDNDAGDFLSFYFLNIGNTYSSNWRENLRIELLPKEASFLKSQIIRTQRETLFAHIVKNKIDVTQFETFGAFSEAVIGTVDPQLAEIIELANEFNNLVEIITVRYNLIVSKGKNAFAKTKWAQLSRDLERKASVDLKSLFSKLDVKNMKLCIFLARVQEAIMNNDIEEVDRLIVNREVRIKNPSRAKTMHAGEYASDQWIGVYKYDYRFASARRIIADIMTAGGYNNV